MASLTPVQFIQVRLQHEHFVYNIEEIFGYNMDEIFFWVSSAWNTQSNEFPTRSCAASQKLIIIHRKN